MLSSLNLRRLQNLVAEDGNKEAYEQLFMHFFPKIRDFVLQMTGSAEASEEIASDTLLQVWLKKSDLAGIRNISAWLHVSARNRAFNFLNKPERTTVFSLDLVETSYVLQVRDPEQHLVYKESLEVINRAIARLPPRCKLIFRLIREEGMSYKEVASVLNISVNTIDAQMAIAIKRIMKKAGYKKSRSEGNSARIVPLQKK